MIIILGNVKKTRNVFLIGTVLGGAFEYLCSLFQEKVFGSISWDYSNHFLNINGRTTIPFAIVWGILCVLMIKIVLPYLSNSLIIDFSFEITESEVCCSRVKASVYTL